jgi:hypothetical protein
MAVNIKLKRSGVAGKIPTTSSLELGEVALNTSDGRAFFKQQVGVTQTVVELATTAGSGSTVTSASYANQATSASFAGYAINAGNAAYATNAGTADFATTASYASNATSASYSISSSFAFQAATASYVPQSTSASYALSSSFNISSSYALSSSYNVSSSYALSGSYALSSSVAVSSSYALSSSYATGSVSSSYALSSSFANGASQINAQSYDTGITTAPGDFKFIAGKIAMTAGAATSSIFTVLAGKVIGNTVWINASYPEAFSTTPGQSLLKVNVSSSGQVLISGAPTDTGTVIFTGTYI